MEEATGDHCRRAEEEARDVGGFGVEGRRAAEAVGRGCFGRCCETGRSGRRLALGLCNINSVHILFYLLYSFGLFLQGDEIIPSSLEDGDEEAVGVVF